MKHDIDLIVRLVVFEDRPGQGVIEIEGKCKNCGAELRYPGPRGYQPHHATTNVGRDMALVPFHTSDFEFNADGVAGYLIDELPVVPNHPAPERVQ